MVKKKKKKGELAFLTKKTRNFFSAEKDHAGYTTSAGELEVLAIATELAVLQKPICRLVKFKMQLKDL